MASRCALQISAAAATHGAAGGSAATSAGAGSKQPAEEAGPTRGGGHPPPTDEWTADPPLAAAATAAATAAVPIAAARRLRQQAAGLRLPRLVADDGAGAADARSPGAGARSALPAATARLLEAAQRAAMLCVPGEYEKALAAYESHCRETGVAADECAAHVTRVHAMAAACLLGDTALQPLTPGTWDRHLAAYKRAAVAAGHAPEQVRGVCWQLHREASDRAAKATATTPVDDISRAHLAACAAAWQRAGIPAAEAQAGIERLIFRAEVLAKVGAALDGDGDGMGQIQWAELLQRCFDAGQEHPGWFDDAASDAILGGLRQWSCDLPRPRFERIRAYANATGQSALLRDAVRASLVLQLGKRAIGHPQADLIEAFLPSAGAERDAFVKEVLDAVLKQPNPWLPPHACAPMIALIDDVAARAAASDAIEVAYGPEAAQLTLWEAVKNRRFAELEPDVIAGLRRHGPQAIAAVPGRYRHAAGNALSTMILSTHGMWGDGPRWLLGVCKKHDLDALPLFTTDGGEDALTLVETLVQRSSIGTPEVVAALAEALVTAGKEDALLALEIIDWRGVKRPLLHHLATSDSHRMFRCLVDIFVELNINLASRLHETCEGKSLLQRCATQELRDVFFQLIRTNGRWSQPHAAATQAAGVAAAAGAASAAGGGGQPPPETQHGHVMRLLKAAAFDFAVDDDDAAEAAFAHLAARLGRGVPQPGKRFSDASNVVFTAYATHCALAAVLLRSAGIECVVRDGAPDDAFRFDPAFLALVAPLVAPDTDDPRRWRVKATDDLVRTYGFSGCMAFGELCQQFRNTLVLPQWLYAERRGSVMPDTHVGDLKPRLPEVARVIVGTMEPTGGGAAASASASASAASASAASASDEDRRRGPALLRDCLNLAARFQRMAPGLAAATRRIPEQGTWHPLVTWQAPDGRCHPLTRIEWHHLQGFADGRIHRDLYIEEIVSGRGIEDERVRMGHCGAVSTAQCRSDVMNHHLFSVRTADPANRDRNNSVATFYGYCHDGSSRLEESAEKSSGVIQFADSALFVIRETVGPGDSKIVAPEITSLVAAFVSACEHGRLCRNPRQGAACADTRTPLERLEQAAGCAAAGGDAALAQWHADAVRLWSERLHLGERFGGGQRPLSLPLPTSDGGVMAFLAAHNLA